MGTAAPFLKDDSASHPLGNERAVGCPGEDPWNWKAQSLTNPWNKGRLTGQKVPLRLQDIWAIHVRLQLGGKTRELALVDLAIDSKLRGCDLVSLHVGDIAEGERVSSRASVLQRKTKRH